MAWMVKHMASAGLDVRVHEASFLADDSVMAPPVGFVALARADDPFDGTVPRDLFRGLAWTEVSVQEPFDPAAFEHRLLACTRDRRGPFCTLGRYAWLGLYRVRARIDEDGDRWALAVVAGPPDCAAVDRACRDMHRTASWFEAAERLRPHREAARANRERLLSAAFWAFSPAVSAPGVLLAGLDVPPVQCLPLDVRDEELTALDVREGGRVEYRSQVNPRVTVRGPADQLVVYRDAGGAGQCPVARRGGPIKGRAFFTWERKPAGGPPPPALSAEHRAASAAEHPVMAMYPVAVRVSESDDLMRHARSDASLPFVFDDYVPPASR